MQSRMIAASLGIAITAWLPTLNFPLGLAITGIIFCAVLMLAIKAYRPLLSWLLLLCMGGVYGCLFGLVLLDQRLAPEHEDVEHTVSGYVVGLPAIKNRYGTSITQFTFNIVDSSLAQNTRSILLRWADAPVLIPGQHWQLQVKLRQPRGLANPAGFDYQQWLVQQGIDAQGLVVGGASNQLAGDSWLSIDRLRWQFSRYLNQFSGTAQHLSLIKALLIADKRDVRAHQWQLFANTGTIHLLVISGLHIGIISAVGFYVGRVAAVFVWPVHILRISAGSAIVFAFLYTASAGFSLPTQRALIMVAAFFSGQLLQRNIPVSTRFSLALLLCLLLDPLAVVGPSFWLSFVAVAAILLCVCSRKYSSEYQRRLFNQSWLRAQFAVLLILTPIILFHFHQAPAQAALINIIAVPLFTIAVVPLLFMFALLLLVPITGLTELVLRFVDQLIEFFYLAVTMADEYFSSVTIVAQPLYVWLFVVLALALVIIPRQIPGRYFALCFLLPLIALWAERSSSPALHITVFDVGQGMSVLITVEGKALLYDVGGSWPEGSMVDSVVEPYLLQHGVVALDAVVISHADNDHAGGFDSLSQKIPIHQLYIGEPLARTYPNQVECSDQHWRWGDAQFEFIPVVGYGKYDGNNRSCVLKIRYWLAGEYHQILLAGDIEREAESDLIATQEQQLKADILFAPHHGSLSSSSWPFIKRIAPKVVVYSTGYKNHFNHPNQRVVARYQALGSAMYNTATDGALTIKYGDTSAPQVQGQRWIKSYYWQ